MTEMYWITRLDAIQNIFIAMGIIFGVAAVIGFIMWLANSEADPESHYSGDKEALRWRATGRKLLHWGAPFFAAALLGIAFVPNQQDTLLIYGVGGTIDWVRSDTTASKIPHQAVEALSRWLDETSKDNNYEKH